MTAYVIVTKKREQECIWNPIIANLCKRRNTETFKRFVLKLYTLARMA